MLSALTTTKRGVSKEWRKLRAAVGVSNLLGNIAKNDMSQPQFVAALIRLAAYKYAEGHVPLGDKARAAASSRLSISGAAFSPLTRARTSSRAWTV